MRSPWPNTLPAVALAVAAACARPQGQSATAHSTTPWSFELPGLPGHDERVSVEIAVNVIRQGSQIALLSERDSVVATVYPFGRAPQTLTAIIPREFIRTGHEKFHLAVRRAGEAMRAPTDSEIDSVRVRLLKVPGPGLLRSSLPIDRSNAG